MSLNLKGKMGKYIWMAVEADEHELPLAVCGTADELGKVLGVSKKAVENSLYHRHSGERSGIRIRRVNDEID